nr:DUF2500 family protein [Clostridia bacterium]
MGEAMVFLLYLLLLPAAFVLYLSPWWIRWLWPRVRYCFAKKQTACAKVIDMQEKYPLYLRDGGWFKTWDEEIFHTHYAVFKQEDGTKRTMRISKADYQGILTGAEGKLTHKGGWFLGFESDCTGKGA